MIGKQFFITLTVFFGFCGINMAQNVNIVLGPDQIAVNQAFTITVVVKNEQIRDISGFPDIPGFNTIGQSQASTTNIINNQLSFTRSITQNYVPQDEGTFTLKPFSVTVNGKEYKSPGKKIKVGPPQQKQQYDPFSFDPFKDMFGEENAQQEFYDIKADAFIAVTTDKKDVYVGEGFQLTFALYESVTNRANLSFFEINEQLTEIKKKIIPPNCWSESFELDKQKIDVEINGKRYRKYILYQSVLYPFNQENINIPSIELVLLKSDPVKSPTFFGPLVKENKKVFESKPVFVKVKSLPPHPLKEKVPVGNYQLVEKISDTDVETGKSYSYQFIIQGEGNIASIEQPVIPSSNIIEFYPPNIRQTIQYNNGRVVGKKLFSYFIIPNEPGDFDLKDHIFMIYFDPVREKYDTLKSEISLHSTGESKKNVNISSYDLGTFYSNIELENNNLTSIKEEGIIKLIANIVLVIMIGITVFLIFKK